MKKSYVLLFVLGALVFCAGRGFAQPAAPAAAAQEAPKSVFNPDNKRDPFLSADEAASIERQRLAELRRREEERLRREAAEQARLAEIERLRLLEEELRRNPAREVINRLRVDGIVGQDAIVNGQLKSIGESILGARITRVSDTSVTFTYKGQSFVKQLPINVGVGVH
jgi:hypothetical protein